MGQLVRFTTTLGHRFDVHLLRVQDCYLRVICLLSNDQVKELGTRRYRKTFKTAAGALSDSVQYMKRCGARFEFDTVDLAGDGFVGLELATSALDYLQDCPRTTEQLAEAS